jgi:hypothetical protein
MMPCHRSCDQIERDRRRPPLGAGRLSGIHLPWQLKCPETGRKHHGDSRKHDARQQLLNGPGKRDRLSIAPSRCRCEEFTPHDRFEHLDVNSIGEHAANALRVDVSRPRCGSDDFFPYLFILAANFRYNERFPDEW